MKDRLTRMSTCAVRPVRIYYESNHRLRAVRDTEVRQSRSYSDQTLPIAVGPLPRPGSPTNSICPIQQVQRAKFKFKYKQ